MGVDSPHIIDLDLTSIDGILFLVREEVIIAWSYGFITHDIDNTSHYISARAVGKGSVAIMRAKMSAKSFRWLFFSWREPEEIVKVTLSVLPKCRQKVFVALFFSWRELEEMCGRLWHGMTLTSVSWGCRSPISIFSYS
jgi:hypothetical protein